MGSPLVEGSHDNDMNNYSDVINENWATPLALGLTLWSLPGLVYSMGLANPTWLKGLLQGQFVH